MTQNQRPADGERDVYQIVAEGRLDPRWTDWFNGTTITHHDPGDGSPIVTVIGATADQTRLRGILSRLWDLNLTVISVTRTAPAREESEADQGGTAWENS